MYRNMFKKVISALTAVAVMSAFSLSAGAYGLNNPTQEQIVAKYNQLSFSSGEPVTFDEDYSINSPYVAGKLSAESMTNGLNALNFCRYVAGLPSDVTLKSEYNTYTQHASVLMEKNNVLSHYPTQPSDMADDFYNLGYYGSSHSNIASGYSNLASAITAGYMEDTDETNITKLGHRRWILNPSMLYTGFGFANRYSAMYSFDNSRTEKFTGDYICWPAKNMPYELYCANDMGYAFSVTLGDAYDTPSLSKVKVTVKSKLQNKTWNLTSANNGTDYSNYLNVDNGGYGMKKCIIFNVGAFEENDVVTVTVKGIYKNGVETPITYDVNFFSMFNENDYGFEQESYDIKIGEQKKIKVNLNPVSGEITGYKWSGVGLGEISIDGSYVTVTAGSNTGKTTLQVRVGDKWYSTDIYNVNYTQLEGKIYYQEKLDENLMRFVAEVDIEDIQQAESGEYVIHYNDEKIDIVEISCAYRSVYADGRVVSAPEGKCFVLTKQYSGYGYDDVFCVDIQLSNYDKGLSREVIIQ